jgi:tellurium resistance protein TerZ
MNSLLNTGNTCIRIDYCRGDTIPSHLTFGLAWDVTNGVNIDLDASAICLDSSFNVVNIVYFGKLRSDDNSIVHHGDEREGDEIGDDEKISIYLERTRSDVAYIAFVINSYSGQELDDISKASCHLFDPVTNIDIARCSLSNNKTFDKRTAIVMSCLYRESNDWFLRVINEPGNAKVANELVPRVKRILQDNPSPLPASVPDPEIIVTAMPEDVDITVDAADSHVSEQEIVSGQNQGSAAPFVPSVPDSASNSHSPFVPPSV